MNLDTSRCDEDRIARFLRHELSPDEQEVLVRHLDDCPACSQRLESQTAETNWWRAAGDYLIDGPFELDPLAGAPTDKDPPPGDLKIQQVLDQLAPSDDPRMLGRIGGYEVAGVVGSGGMGVVLKAFDAALDRYVAIKMLSPLLAASGAARQRFSREARAAAAVVHDNVSEIYGVAEAGGLPYLVMPYVRGMSLAQRLDREGPLAATEVLRIARQTAAGLAAAHAQGLVHRDIKPANILLSEGVERVQITDFGLARAADDASLTRTGTVAGTPQYMSPEQARGEKVDQRSDLFSLGSVMYAMCTGRAPFRAETSYGVMRRISDDAPTPIREINPDVPDWLCAIVERLMAKQPGERFQSAAEVASLLEDCLAHVQHPASSPLPRSLVKSSSNPAKRSFLSRLSLRSRPVLGGLPVVATLGFVLLGLFGWQSTAAPDISGAWSGEGWGRVLLEEQRPGEYEGTYTDTFGEERGALHIVWSRVERRFNGTWREKDDRFGEISLRLSDGMLRGAWTTDAKSKIQPGTPRLADLTWLRVSGPVGDRLADFLPGDAEPSDSILNNSKPVGGESLIDAVREFNEHYAHYKPGATPNPLTDEEVIACLRWRLAEEGGDDSRIIEGMQDVVQRRQLPAGWRFEASSLLDGAEGDRFQAWIIRLRTTVTTDGKPRSLLIRRRILGQLNEEGERMELPVVKVLPQFVNLTPLAAALHEFNAAHRSLDGVGQPPLTEEEVVAAIRYQKTQRNTMPITNGEFDALQHIAEIRQLPPGIHFELLSSFEPGDSYRYRIWSVRLVLPRTTKPGWTYACEIRKQFVDSRSISSEDIVWGKVAQNGLVLGVALEPRSEQYAVGQQVVPHFFIRNTGKNYVRVIFPRVLTHASYRNVIAVDSAGRDIPIERDPAPGGPVGHMEISLKPGGLHVLQGLPITFGDVPRGSTDVVVRAKAGQQVRMQFALTNFGVGDDEPMEAGYLMFDVVAAPKATEDAATGETADRSEGYDAEAVEQLEAHVEPVKRSEETQARMMRLIDRQREAGRLEAAGDYEAALEIYEEVVRAAKGGSELKLLAGHAASRARKCRDKLEAARRE